MLGNGCCKQTLQTMRANFESAIANAINTVASLLNRPSNEIAAQALKEGAVREMVMKLVIAQAQ